MEFMGKGAILSKTFYKSKTSLILDEISDEEKDNCVIPEE
jgi:hypothetical protein